VTQLKFITVCANEAYSKAWIDKHLSDIFPIKSGLKEGDTLSLLVLNFALEYTIRKVQQTRRGCNRMMHISFWPVQMILIY
jgi:hypothetical protein